MHQQSLCENCTQMHSWVGPAGRREAELRQKSDAAPARCPFCMRLAGDSWGGRSICRLLMSFASCKVANGLEVAAERLQGKLQGARKQSNLSRCWQALVTGAKPSASFDIPTQPHAWDITLQHPAMCCGKDCLHRKRLLHRCCNLNVPKSLDPKLADSWQASGVLFPVELINFCRRLWSEGQGMGCATWGLPKTRGTILLFRRSL